MNPAGLLVMMGLANIVTGFVYRLPMPSDEELVLAVAKGDLQTFEEIV